MSAVILLIITSIIVILILFAGKKLCDMAIKTEITEKYSTLIFTPEQKVINNKANEENLKWLEENSCEIEIISHDGLRLKGYEIKADKPTDNWVIAVHGYLSRGSDMVDYAKHFIEYGDNILIIDLRTHGKSEGKYIGMGWLDKSDLELWIERVIDENRDAKIILYGISMGAATVTMATGDELPENVKLCIADCRI